MPSLPETDPKQITPSPCPLCSRAVVVASLRGKRVLVERCRAGAGDIALTGDLVGGALAVAPFYLADRVSNATSWRLHAGNLCAGPLTSAFSAGAFARKGKVENEIFRQLGARNRRGRR
jgi:hypothetical protein